MIHSAADHGYTVEPLQTTVRQGDVIRIRSAGGNHQLSVRNVSVLREYDPREPRLTDTYWVLLWLDGPRAGGITIWSEREIIAAMHSA